MIKVSDEYKVAMSKFFRDNAFMLVTIGVVESSTQDAASADGEVGDEYAWWSNLNIPLGKETLRGEEFDYATLEQNFLPCDGSQRFLPKEEVFDTSTSYCIISTDIKGSISFSFDGNFTIKGLFIDFTKNYPTSFKVTTNEDEFTFSNNNQLFTTSLDIGANVNHITITPLTMIGGEQRLRIGSITMGAGIVLTNNEISDANITKTLSPISEELPATDLSVNTIDYADKYNYDNPEALISYLRTGQPVQLRIGQTLEDNSVEYLDVAKLRLESWSNSYGKMSFTAKDKLAEFTSTKYSSDTSGTIHSRSIYSDCEAILTDMGLNSSEYIIDEFLQDIMIVNPLPEASHSELLQLLAFAGRCILYQDNKGRIVIKNNFPQQIERELSTNSNASWGSLDHLLDDSVTVHYSDFTQNFSAVDDTMQIIPSDSNDYLDGTGFVSSAISDSNGEFANNPKIACTFECGYEWTDLKLKFAGNIPKEFICHTSLNNVSVADITFSDFGDSERFGADFGKFDKIEIEFTKTSPNCRVLVDYIGFGLGGEYKLERHNMLENVLGTIDENVKDVRVRKITYVNGDNGPEQVDDNIYYVLPLNNIGNTVTYENPLISSDKMTVDVANWLAWYYGNEIDYECQYRGEPKIEAGDFIKMENDYNEDLVTQVTSAELSFNGAYKGKIKVHRAIE